MQYYDVLFTQKEGLEIYTKYVQDHILEGSVIEMASGTGDLLNTLSLEHDVLGVDLDPEMKTATIEKYPHLEEFFHIGDFTSYKSDRTFDNLVCIGDSLNYILNKDDLQAFVDTASDLSDHLILDMHHPYRLIEFEDGFYEEGSTETFDYAYQIDREDDYLMHIINFLDGSFEAIQQWVFHPNVLIEMLNEKGYKLSVLSDFEEGEILEEGEKVRIIAHR